MATVKLYFLRHAEALDGADDARRPLSPHGEVQCRDLGRFLKKAGIKFDAVFTSPLVRARQTAEAVSSITNHSSPVSIKVVNELVNELAFDAFAAWLRRLAPDARHALLVGHDPSMSSRVRGLLGMENEEALQMPKGSLATLETSDRSTFKLKYFITPKILGS